MFLSHAKAAESTKFLLHLQLTLTLELNVASHDEEHEEVSDGRMASNYKHTLTSVHSAREAVLIQRQRDRTRKTLCSS